MSLSSRRFDSGRELLEGLDARVRFHGMRQTKERGDADASGWFRPGTKCPTEWILGQGETSEPHAS